MLVFYSVYALVRLRAAWMVDLTVELLVGWRAVWLADAKAVE